MRNNDQGSSNRGQQTSSSTRGGTHEQHVKAGQQSHKNDKKSGQGLDRGMNAGNKSTSTRDSADHQGNAGQQGSKKD